VTTDTINIGILGLGFMGTTHLRAYQAAAGAGFPCRIAAVCDPVENRRKGLPDGVAGNIGEAVKDRLFDPEHVKGYADADAFLADPNLHLISICTQTPTHVDLATKALKAGKHVLLEKPIAITSADVRKVQQAADAAGKICMPAMCMRFWPAWSWLKQKIDSREFGACRSLSLQRLGGTPAWSLDFYLDPRRSGGAIIDLHIHDADFVRFCFGEPQRVTSVGYKTGEAINRVTTTYHYPQGPQLVTAEGGWLSSGFGFRMRYVAEFERATADFDIGRSPQLLLAAEGKSQEIQVDPLNGYDHEVRHLLEAIREKKSGLLASISDAVATARLLEAEIESVNSGRTITI
jgi:predicted dehydrogenase